MARQVLLVAGFVFAALLSGPAALSSSYANAAPALAKTIYRGQIRLPDFVGRDRAFSYLRTQIVTEMQSGPNFDFRYAIIEVGCGTGCRIAVVGDVANGKLFKFPYGGEDYQTLWLKYGVKSNIVRAQWVSKDRCIKDDLAWNGIAFRSLNRRVVGGSDACND